MSGLDESVVEEAALGWFAELGYGVRHGAQIAPGEPVAERDSFGDVVLAGRLRDAIARLNPAIPPEAQEEALRKVLRIGTPSLTQTNRAFHKMLRDGVEVEYPRPEGGIAGDRVRLVNFVDPVENDWLVVNQFTVIEGQHNRRPDLVVFVNGLPVALIELKNAADEDATIWTAYQQVQTYKAEISSLLSYNELIVVSDGLQARIGSLTANQEWFKVWRTIDGEGEAPRSALELEVMVRGVFEPRRLLDLLEHFVVFEEDPDNDGLHKIIAGCAASDEAKEIRDDIAFFQAIKAQLSKTSGTQRPPEEIDAAIRQLVSKAITADEGVIDVFTAAGLKKPDISILSDQFLAEVRGLKHKNVAAELLAKLLKDEIKLRSPKNVVQSRLFSEMLKHTLNAYHNRAIATQEVIEELIKLAKQMNSGGNLLMSLAVPTKKTSLSCSATVEES